MPTYIQGAYGGTQTPGTTGTIVLPVNPTLGNLVVLHIQNYNVPTAITSVVDSSGNAYINAGSTADPNGRMFVYYLYPAPANANKTITVIYTVSGNENCFADEFRPDSGMLFNFDKNVFGTGTGVTINTPSITPTNANSLVVAQAYGSVITAPLTGGTLSGWTAALESTGGDSAAEYILNQTGAKAVAWTETSATWFVIGSVFSQSPIFPGDAQGFISMNY